MTLKFSLWKWRVHFDSMALYTVPLVLFTILTAILMILCFVYFISLFSTFPFLLFTFFQICCGKKCIKGYATFLFPELKLFFLFKCKNHICQQKLSKAGVSKYLYFLLSSECIVHIFLIYFSTETDSFFFFLFPLYGIAYCVKGNTRQLKALLCYPHTKVYNVFFGPCVVPCK